MVESYRRLKKQRALGEVEESGFTLIELLIVIVVLGILAAIVVFALGGVTGKSVVAACNSDAKTVGTGLSAYQADQQLLLTDQVNQNQLTAPTSAAIPGTIQSWPQAGVTDANAKYRVFIAGSLAGSGNTAGQTTEQGIINTAVTAATTLDDGSTPAINDVIVYINGTDKYYDATQLPSGACATA